MATVGNFIVEVEGGSLNIQGPQDYMAERGAARLRQIEAGRDAVFNFGASRPGANIATLVGVSLQTDYAAFQGQKLTRAGL